MNTPSPYFIAVIVFELPDDGGKVIASLWAGADFCTVWSSGRGEDTFQEFRIHHGPAPRGVGLGLWGMVNVLATLHDAGLRGVVELALTGSVDVEGFNAALDFVNAHVPKFEAADLY